MKFWFFGAGLIVGLTALVPGIAYGRGNHAVSGMATTKPPADVQATVGAVAMPPKPQSTNVLEDAVNEGLALLGRGQVKEAVPLFKQVLREDKNNRRALFGLGTCYVELRQYREARLVLERMIELYPDAFEAMNNLAWMYATASDPVYRDGRKAVKYAQQAVLLSPKSFEIWNTLSESYFVAGEYEKAQRAAAEALRLSQENQAPERVVREYERQFEKCRRAADAMSLIE